MRRIQLGGVCFVVVLLNALGGVTVAPLSGAASADVSCPQQVLVLSAMPLELDPLLAKATVDLRHPVMLNSRPFVFGTLEGNRVIMGLTGIGPENALAATQGAFARFRCADGTSEISDVVFSGTSGGDYIGDVSVPASWSYDGTALATPEPFPVATSPGLLAIARKTPVPALEKSTPPGDPACACELTDSTQLPITVKHAPDVVFAPAGLTTDPFGGRTLPCAPDANDIFGCTPCRERDHGTVGQVQNVVTNGPSFLETSFFTGYMNSPTPSTPVWQDNETAIVAAVAESHGAPFIGFRAASDGGGDPLSLPGFPAEFFVYRQLAADNAAAMTLAFLHQLAA
ncbi:MAG TPA: hypothetical protein VMV14_08375 [Acidimicrobiales bacterium]|nr:hypothetical protein [Acidimicrobiales bacterium]